MIVSALRRLHRDRRGEAALEFAIVGTLFVLLLLAPAELGLMVWTGSALQGVAEQTARCAAIGSCANPSSFAVALAAKWIGSGAITAQDVSVQHSSTTCGTASGNFLTVSITGSTWVGAWVAPLQGGVQKVTACFPN